MSTVSEQLLSELGRCGEGVIKEVSWSLWNLIKKCRLHCNCSSKTSNFTDCTAQRFILFSPWEILPLSKSLNNIDHYLLKNSQTGETNKSHTNLFILGVHKHQLDFMSHLFFLFISQHKLYSCGCLIARLNLLHCISLHRKELFLMHYKEC